MAGSKAFNEGRTRRRGPCAEAIAASLQLGDREGLRRAHAVQAARRDVIHFAKDQGRTRRLEPCEEAKLLEHPPAHLHALITAALETGMRRGELLALRWRDVKWAADPLLLPAEITKTAEARDVPAPRLLHALAQVVLQLNLLAGGRHIPFLAPTAPLLIQLQDVVTQTHVKSTVRSANHGRRRIAAEFSFMEALCPGDRVARPQPRLGEEEKPCPVHDPQPGLRVQNSDR